MATAATACLNVHPAIDPWPPGGPGAAPENVLGSTGLDSRVVYWWISAASKSCNKHMCRVSWLLVTSWIRIRGRAVHVQRWATCYQDQHDSIASYDHLISAESFSPVGYKSLENLLCPWAPPTLIPPEIQYTFSHPQAISPCLI